MDLAAQILADFCYYRTKTLYWHKQKQRGGFLRAQRKLTPALRALLDDLVVWCRERAIEPRLWVYGLFKMRNWNAAPRLDRNSLCSEKLIPKFRRISGVGFFGRRVEAERQKRDEQSAFDPNRDTAAVVEETKRRLVVSGQGETCRLLALESTLGFHPKSSACLSCPVRGPCAVHIQSFVPFSILTLRRGGMTSAQAQIVARNRYAVEDALNAGNPPSPTAPPSS